MTQNTIELNEVSYRYPRSKRWVLNRINLKVERGEFIAVMGENGAGKSTICQILNGIIPNSIGGRLKGEVLIEGLNTQESSITQLATRVGIVLEDPETQLFTTTVMSEVAFGPENLSIPPAEIRERVRWALDVVRLTGFEDRMPTALSGGQKQRLAIAAAIATRPSIIVLDEATSQLDPVGVVEVLSVVRDLNKKFGITIIMATDQSEEVARVADRVIILHKGCLVTSGTPRQVFSNTELFKKYMLRAPQVSQLGARLDEAGHPLPVFPIEISEARDGLITLLKDKPVPARITDPAVFNPQEVEAKSPVIQVQDLEFTYQPHNVQAVKGVSFEVNSGEFVAIIGQNGSGKTTVLKNLLGLLKPGAGKVIVAGMDTNKTAVAEMARHVGFVLQNPDQQLFAETVESEISYGPRNLGLDKAEIANRVSEVLEIVGLQDLRAEFPPALSKGDRAKVVIACALALHPEILVLDEPTTGQDYRGCHQIMQIADIFHRSGKTVVFVTHHMALVAEYARRAIVMCDGRILLDDRTANVFNQPEVVRKAYIIPPQITELSQRLPESMGLPRTPLTVNQLVDPVLARFKKH